MIGMTPRTQIGIMPQQQQQVHTQVHTHIWQQSCDCFFMALKWVEIPAKMDQAKNTSGVINQVKRLPMK